MQDQHNSHQSNSGGVGIFILFIVILLLIAGAAGMFYGLEESKIAHRIVDDVLLAKRENWQLRDTERREHKDIQDTTGADIIWTDREVAVGVPVTTDLEGAARWVKEHLRDTDVKLIAEKESEWHDMDAYKLMLGIAVKSGKDSERKFLTDTIYFFHHGNLTNRDMDIPREPEPKDGRKGDPEEEKQQ